MKNQMKSIKWVEAIVTAFLLAVIAAVGLFIWSSIAAAATNVHQQPVKHHEYYDKWNQCMELLKGQWDEQEGTWWKIRCSLDSDPPEHVHSLDRIAWAQQIIESNNRINKLLSEMQKLEGK